jgi:hypothetical protein
MPQYFSALLVFPTHPQTMAAALVVTDTRYGQQTGAFSVSLADMIFVKAIHTMCDQLQV